MQACTVLLLFTLCGAVGSLSLDSNVIRSSAEAKDQVRQVRCTQDSDCQSGHYCLHTSTQGAMCTACHPKRQRCHNNHMCCAGLKCDNGECRQPKKKEQNSKKNRPASSDNKNKKKEKGQAMATCVRSTDCEEGLCCRRYLKDNKCLRIPKEGEVCYPPGHSKGPRAVNLCNCDKGLSCQAQDKGPNPIGVCKSSKKPNKKRTTHSDKGKNP